MAKNVKCIEVRSADGHLILSLRLYDDLQSAGGATKSAGHPAGRQANNQKSQGHEGNGEKDDDAITDAQKRYLFRILADQGTDGEQALNYLKERFGVENLADVTKRDASALIEELLASGSAA